MLWIKTYHTLLSMCQMIYEKLINNLQNNTVFKKEESVLWMCTNCGYTDEINDKCPMCNCPDIRRLRRVTGYLTGDYKSAFNKGKQQEVEMRVRHA